MAPPKAVPAVPATFHFKMRLVDSTGKAFEGKDYQLRWGGKLVQEGVTGAGGLVQADLDDNYDSGLLDVGDRDGQAKFVARWTIPLDVVPLPPPPPTPAAPPHPRPHKPPPNPPAQRGWTDEADPPPPFPVYPVHGAEDKEAWERYQQQQRAWDEWAARRDERMAEARRRERDAELSREIREGNEKLRREFRGQRTPKSVAEADPSEAPPMSPEEMQTLRDRLQRYRDEAHAARVLLYELSWRLRNLGYLPSSHLLVFPSQDDTTVSKWLQDLQDGLWRYSCAHEGQQLGLPDLHDMLQGEASATMKAVADAIKKEHDG